MRIWQEPSSGSTDSRKPERLSSGRWGRNSTGRDFTEACIRSPSSAETRRRCSNSLTGRKGDRTSTWPSDWQTQTAAFAGQWQHSQEFSRRSIDLTTRSDAKGVAAQYAAEQALRSAAFGQCHQARAEATQALALERKQDIAHPQRPRTGIMRRDRSDAASHRRTCEAVSQRYARQRLWLPAIRAAIELRRGNAAQAIQLLEALRYEAAAEFWPQNLRGMAFLTLKRGREAAAEFQKILDHRGEALVSPLYPLAHLGIARALALSGDTAKGRKAYQDFFVLWKDADADLPILIEAKKEYEKLK